LGILIINFKNYPEVLGRGSLELAEAAQAVHQRTSVEIMVAPPGPMLGIVASKVKIPVLSQSVGEESGDKSTGAFLPEAVKGAGGEGTILNHSESRRPFSVLRALVPRVQSLSLEVCLCARTSTEAAKLGKLGSEYLAVEPPELIGSGVAVSNARPGLVSQTVAAARKSGYGGKVLCGAGIVDGGDVRRAIELGADGVLVASSVVKARNWQSKIEELAHSLM
jgi:triosephosphate isomerase (TIM)